MTLRLTTLSENSVAQGNFLGEWGLSVLVETETGNILLDTGRSVSTTYNADTLGIDLRRIDKIVLSHAHHDHTGGLVSVLRRMKKEVEVIAHPDVWAAKYAQRPDQEPRYIGIPFQRAELESLGAHFNLATGPVTLAPNIMTTGEIPMTNDFETIDPKLVVKAGDGWQPEKIMDDQALIINSPAGLVVIFGCAHRGPVNTLYHIRKLTGTTTIHTVLGGSHLISADANRMRLTIDAFKELGVQRLGLCHCTGLPAAARLAQEFGDRFFFNVAGTVINLP